AAEAPLTLAEAQRRAIAHSRQLPAKDFAARASREAAVAAGQLPDPIVKLGVDNLPASGPDRFDLNKDFMTMRRVGVMQEITLEDKRRLRADRLTQTADKSLDEKDVVAAAIERDTALAWLDLYYAKAMSAVIEEQGTQAKLEIQASDGAYRAGRGSQADVFAARSAVASFEDRNSEYKRRILNAQTMLARWIGTDTDFLLAEKPDMDAIRLDPAALETQLAHHPEIAVSNRQIDIAETEARLAQANKKSDWSVEVAFQQRGPAYSNMVSVGISIPFQWDQKNRQDRELSSKLAMVDQAKSERDEMLRDHVAQTRVMINEWNNDRERAARYARDLVPLAAQRTLSGITAYSGGKASLAEVLAARRNEIDVRLQALQLQADTARIWARLNFLFPTGATASHGGIDLVKDVK
ncbi:MAG: TolC family protein, partial [Herminiimonas sp.]|nr:TolC family protein [Herminiimonas sp.]